MHVKKLLDVVAEFGLSFKTLKPRKIPEQANVYIINPVVMGFQI